MSGAALQSVASARVRVGFCDLILNLDVSPARSQVLETVARFRGCVQGCVFTRSLNVTIATRTQVVAPTNLQRGSGRGSVEDHFQIVTKSCVLDVH